VDALREHVEVPGHEYIARWFPGDDEGPLHEMDNRYTFLDTGALATSQDARLLHPPYARRGIPADDPELYRWHFRARQNEGADELGPLIDLARLFDPSRTTDEDFGREVWERVDVEQFLRVWAVRLNTDDWDSWGARRGKNCYFYFLPHRRRWVLIPWDMELTYGNADAFAIPPIGERYINQFIEVERFLNQPRVRRRFYGILAEMIERPLRPEFLAPYLEQLRLAGVERTDVGLPGGFIDRRRAHIAERIESAVFPNVRLEVLTGGGGTIRADSPLVRIEGRAPVEITHIGIVAGGESLPDTVRFSDRDPLLWECEAHLPAGRRRIEFAGFDGRGRLVDSTGVDVEVSAAFVRGDADGSGRVSIADAVRILLHLFAEASLPCLDAADAGDDGRLSMEDALLVLRYLFLAGEPPPPPFPLAGQDPTPDDLRCGLARGPAVR
ncbi:MAG: CotH kinase family protein, partial [Planctomycetes bacterium]|nr:CotH kinase family protein [Planctomycetota bacterium]